VTVTYSEVMARNARAARARLGLEQELLAARMRALGFESWRRQTVASVEKAARRVTAEEILGLGYALETSVAALMMPAESDKQVAFPSGHSVGVRSVQMSVSGYTDGAIRWTGDVPEFSDSAGPRVQAPSEGITITPAFLAPGFAQEGDDA
jgi:transcriptional regulator with XRE-family HTH domain